MAVSKLTFLSIVLFAFEASSQRNHSATDGPNSTIPAVSVDHFESNSSDSNSTESTSPRRRPLAEVHFGPTRPNYKAFPSPIKYKFKNYTSQMTVDEQKFIVSQAFRAWSSVAAVDFQEIGGSETEKVTIMFTNDPSSAFVGVAVFRTDPLQLQFNDGKQLEKHIPNGRFYKIAVHEIGHILGLSHTISANCSMVDSLDQVASSLCEDDIAAVRTVYGMRNELPDACRPHGPPSVYMIANSYSSMVMVFPPSPNPRVLNSRFNPRVEQQQQVVFQEMTTNPVRAYRISNAASNLTLSIGTRGNAEQRPFVANNQSQLFALVARPDGFCHIKSIANNQLIGVSPNNTKDSRVYIGPARNDSSKAQEWQIRQWPGSLCHPQPGFRYKIANPRSGLLLSVPFNASSPPQEFPWVFFKVGKDYVLSTPPEIGKALEMTRTGSIDWPLNLQTYEATDVQHWNVTRAGNTDYCSIIANDIIYGHRAIAISDRRLMATPPNTEQTQMWDLTLMP